MLKTNYMDNNEWVKKKMLGVTLDKSEREVLGERDGIIITIERDGENYKIFGTKGDTITTVSYKKSHILALLEYNLDIVGVIEETLIDNMLK